MILEKRRKISATMESILRDVLFMHNMKPWWESLRSYAVGLMVSSTLLISAKVISNEVICVPTNFTSEIVFSASIASYADKQCVSQAPEKLVINFWWVGLLITALLFVANNVWEHDPVSNNCIATFQKNFQLLDGVTLDIKDILRYAATPIPSNTPDSNKEEVSKCRKIVSVIKNLKERIHASPMIGYRVGNEVAKAYCRRNLLTMATCVAWYGFIFALDEELVDLNPTFPCTLEPDLNLTCSHVNINILKAVAVIYSICVIQVLYAAAFGVWRSYNRTDEGFLLEMNRYKGNIEQVDQYKEIVNKLFRDASQVYFQNCFVKHQESAVIFEDSGFFSMFADMFQQQFAEFVNKWPETLSSHQDFRITLLPLLQDAGRPHNLEV